jgi:serine/threonine protein kinase
VVSEQFIKLFIVGVDLKTKEDVAIKVESRKERNYLEKEAQMYTDLSKATSEEEDIGVPRVRWYGKEGLFRVVVLDLMGPSLSDLFYSVGKQFSLKTTLMLAEQMINRLEFVHKKRIVHRDVKPGNFVMGLGRNEGKVFIIDFGLSNYYQDQTGKHIGYNEDASFHGTHRYASVNSHFKVEQSRRDDLESLGYVLVYFLRGGLPWQNVKAKKKKRRVVIGEMKRELSIDQLTAGLPSEFATYMHYVRSLNFLDLPDYEYMRRLFRTCMMKHQFLADGKFDWSAKPGTISVAPSMPAPVNSTPILTGVTQSYMQPNLLPSLQTLAALDQQHRIFSADPLAIAPSLSLLSPMHQLVPSMPQLMPSLMSYQAKPIAIAPAAYPPLTVSIPQASIKQAMTTTASSVSLTPAVAAPVAGPMTRKRKAAEIEHKPQPQRNVRTRASAQK